MIRPSSIDPGKTFIGKSGLMRRVNKFRVCGVDGSGPIGDVFYTPIDRSGKESKEKSCYSGDFARWAVSEANAQEPLKPGERVVMHTCYEAHKEKYKDKVWTVESEPWDLCGSEVVRLEGHSGGFATEYLKRVEA
ncbi:hypothetical protein IAQ67_13975 [Paenibacillus peoriae]|uniref:Uncharacterized protein n=1 Tax=Paenibacillus peoriae TaxID=59893 RepID=A0A7H0YGX9_9BACL|nr:hypothetical protein [Paenibacillus peoriae]QNR70337.1 hypothetical protein IAQ67_13975 [Paenibacillus peoriae]